MLGMFRCVFHASVSLVSCSKYVLLFFFVWVGVCWLLRCSCSCFSVCCLFCVVFAVVSALRAFGLEVLRLSSHAASCRLCVAHGTRNLAANPSHSTVSGQGGDHVICSPRAAGRPRHSHREAPFWWHAFLARRRKRRVQLLCFRDRV